MARRRSARTRAALLSEIDARLRDLGRDAQGMSLREKVLLLVDVQSSVSDLGVGVAVEHGASCTNARERIRFYLLENVGVVVGGAELAVVSGISEYARRIRELRVEQGYKILTGASNDPDAGVELRPDDYLLVSKDRDQDAARRWAIANRIRRRTQGSRARVLEFFKENVGAVVTTEDLAYVARGAREYQRRVRELRTEEGYAIATRFTGRPDLGMGEYVMLSADRVRQPHDRHIPPDIEKAVFARDENTCRLCDWNMDRWTQSDPRFLEIHHIDEHQHGGANVKENLIVVCNRCHDDVHAGKRDDVIEKIREQL